jgi:small subunit ribosomal protein S9
MNFIIRQSLRRTISTSTPFVPPASLRDIERVPRREKREVKSKPLSPTFYTGRSTYYDQVIQLETAIQHSRQALTTLQLIPLPAFAREKLPPLQPMWKPKENMSTLFNSRLTTSRYRRITSLLNQLGEFQSIASTAGCYELGKGISEILQLFEKENAEAVLARGKRKPVQFDKYGRTYTLGRRKTSAARVWIIPVKQQQQQDIPPPSDERSDAELADQLLGLHPTSKALSSTVTTTTVLVNNIPLAEYFAITTDRERVIRPFKVAGVLGKYNVFALVRGGGTSGQSGAIAHGIAKGLVAHEPQAKTILRKGVSNSSYHSLRAEFITSL